MAMLRATFSCFSKAKPLLIQHHGLRFISSQFRRFDLKDEPLMLQDMLDHVYTATGGQKVFDPEAYLKDRSTLLDVLPKTQDELPPRTQRDSYSEIKLPLSTDRQLLDNYINIFKRIRTGRLLECLDMFAVHVCFKYALNPKQNTPSPFCIVTALVDNLTFHHGKGAINVQKDLILTGFVSWVGKTSMEVTMNIIQDDEEKIRALFVMVARDPLNRGSAVINPMKLESDEDRMYFEQGTTNMELRKQEGAKSLTKVAPDADESRLIHDLFLQSEELVDARIFKRKRAGQDGPNFKLMSEAVYSDITLCHPAHRNRYNKIFGGYVMRLAYELGWASATSFCRTRMRAAFIDDIWFRAPVEVGSILHLKAVIGYTQGSSALVQVRADVENYMTGETELTNVFYFMFTTMDGSDVPTVLPRSYKEYITYLDSRRHYIKHFPLA